MKKTCNRVLASIQRQQWAIMPDALETLIAIAQRQYSNPIEASTIADIYQSGGMTDAPPNIAVIDVVGPIFPRADFFTNISGATNAEWLTSAINEALNDPEITGIILRFDSPGGQVTGIHELAHFIYESRDIKPIVSYVTGAAASASYWIAAATSYIFADRTALLGSIGIVATWTDDSAARKESGLTDYELVSSQSPNKRLKPNSKDGRAALQADLDGLADIFISDVAQFRGVTTEKVMADFGQGGVLLADAAIKAGLADELSSLRDVIALLSDGGGDATKTGVLGMASFNRDGLRAETKTQEEIDQEEAARLAEEEEKARLANEKAGAGSVVDDKKQGDGKKEAIEDEEDNSAKEEDKGAETDAMHIRANSLAQSDPSIYGAILRRGARRERLRIKEIEEMVQAGREEMIYSAKFMNPLTVGAASREIIRAEAMQRDLRLKNYREDATFTAPAASFSTGDNQAAKEKSLLDQVKCGAETKLGVKK